jgi:hypothetical protein
LNASVREGIPVVHTVTDFELACVGFQTHLGHGQEGICSLPLGSRAAPKL